MYLNRFRLAILWMSFLLSACGGSSNSITSQSGNNSTPQINSNQMGGAIQTNLSSLLQSVTTIAGVVPGSADGTGTAARFKSPMSVTTDGTNVYVVDSDNNTIRKIVIATGMVTTLAGTTGISGSADGTGSAARFNYPQGITTDGTNLYVTDTDNGTIRKIIISTGEVSTLAGTAGVYGAAADGIGSAARFSGPMGITTDGTNLFVADSNCTIRKIIIASRAVTTLAGTAYTYDSADGIGSAAHFNRPMGVTTDGINLYITDYGNYTVRKLVIATGDVTTLAGTARAYGFTDGIGSAARFSGLTSITMDGANLFVADPNNQTIRMITIATGTVTTLAGTTGAYGSKDATGTAARFHFPWGLTTDGTNIYVADFGNSTIRKLVIDTKDVTTLAGFSPMGSDNGTGTAARFAYPGNVTTDGTNIYVADSFNNTIRKIVIATGTVTTFVGTAGVTGFTDGNGTTVRFNYPVGITTDGTNLYVTDTNNSAIRKIVISTGEVTTLAGGLLGTNDGVGPEARFNAPGAITTDGTNLYIVDYYNNTIRKIVIATRVVTTFAGTAGISGSADGTGTAARFKSPKGVTTDGTNIYVADSSNATIRKINISTGVVSTFAGTAGVFGSIDGIGTSARFDQPGGITTDGTNLYIGDNSSIRKIVISTGAVTTLAGITGTNGYADGIATTARFSSQIGGITTDGTSLYIADTDNNTVRKIQ